MLARLFNSAKKLQNKDADVRQAFLERLTPDKAAQLQAELVEAYRAEDRAHNRTLILPLLTELAPLADTLDGEHGGEFAAYLAKLAPNPPAALAEHPKVIRARLFITTEPAELRALIHSIDSIELIIELTTSCKNDAQEALLQHPLLQSVDALHALELASRNRDKRVNRHARDRLQAMKLAQEAHAQANKELARITETISRVAGQPADTPVAKETARTHLIALQQQFEAAVAELDSSVAKLSDCGLDATQQTTQSPKPDPFASIDLTPPKESPFSQVLAAMPQRHTRAARTDLENALANAEQQWQSLSKLEAPPLELTAQFVARTERLHQHISALSRMEATRWRVAPELPNAITNDASAVWQAVSKARSWIKESQKLSTAIGWPSDLEVPEVLTQQAQQRSDVQAQIDALAQQVQQLCHKVAKNLDAAEQSIEAGESKAAQAQLNTARDHSTKLPGKDAAQFEKRTKQLYARLSELKDWQTFATSPKREALIASMEALVGIDKQPEALSDAIKALRDEWNALGRPANRQEHKLREAFDDAAERAFEPCRAHFAALGEQRKQNLEKRRALVAQLEQYLKTNDWSNADFDAAEQIMRTARNEWRAFFPVPRGKGKGLTSQFEALQSELHDLLQKEWQRNIDAKQQLIDRAKQLQNDAQLNEQIDGVKNLQAEWKHVGVIPRHQDQKLWREFREICDAVFAARTQAYTELDEAYAERRTAAISLNRQFEASFADAPSKKALSHYRAGFAEIGDLGRDGKDLINQHRKLCDRYDQLMADASRQRKVQRITDIQLEDERLCVAEAGGESTTSEYAEFAKRTAHAEPSDLLEELTITAEIAADLPSPPHASARRMAIQVSMMNKGGGNAALPTREALLRSWCEVGGKGTSTTVTELRSRFFAALSGQATDQV